MASVPSWSETPPNLPGSRGHAAKTSHSGEGAVEKGGIKIAVNTDAHSIAELRFISAGVKQARRAWLTAADVLNAQPLRKMLTLLRR